MWQSFSIADHNRFRNICAGFQSLVIASAVLIGGAWTLYVFNAQLSVENAEAKVEKLRLELERRPSIRIEVTPEVVSIPSEDKLHILVNVSITNDGNKDTRIKWENEPIYMAKIEEKNGQLQTKNLVRADFYHLGIPKFTVVSGTGIRAGSTFRSQTILQPQETGLYLVTFKAEAKEDHITQPELVDKPITWSQSAYVAVNEPLDVTTRLSD